MIAQSVKLHPDRFAGIGAIPQLVTQGTKFCLEELDRCVNELGFVGIKINPDPGEGSAEVPHMGDEYWYPLYEKLVELDVPALVHSAQCGQPRVPYTLHFINEESIAIISLLTSRVFLDFPKLKLVISHGGGAIPYQVGRFRAFYMRPGRRVMGDEPFEVSLRRLYFDTCLYSKEALELLIKVVGPDRCLFGAERPGTGSEIDPDTGRSMDDIKPLIDDIDWLTEADRKMIYGDNAKAVHNLKDLP